MSRLTVIILTFCCFLSVPAVAQDSFEEKVQKKYDNFRDSVFVEYDKFREESNRKYAKFFRNVWGWFTRKKGKEKPKDESVPVVVFDDKNFKMQRLESKPITISEVVRPIFHKEKLVTVTPIENRPDHPFADKVNFEFYGTKCSVRFTEDFKLSLDDVNDATLEKAWMRLSESRHNNFIYDCLKLRDDLQLSDWAYLKMLDVASEACVGKGNVATFLMGYVFFQSGYRMRFARKDDSLFLLYGSDHSIYGTSYFLVDGVKMYPYNCNLDGVYISSLNYEKECGLSLVVDKLHLFECNPTESRTLTSKRYPDISVNVSTNKNLIDFYNTYPASTVGDNVMTKWSIYANTPVDDRTRNELYPQLKKMIAGQSKLQAVERLLNWVQTAFVYEYDDKVWGCDRPFFGEETLYYDYCDCEDRAILFSHLVRDLVGLNVILVYYPGHLATAVHFTDNVKGDYIELEGQRYVVCDPTYENAPVGWTMRNMNNATAKVILLH